jgi:gliding motility-associated protein GldC
MKQSDITFSVTLDENKNPEKIHWSADDSGMVGKKACKSVLISIWDGNDKSTLRIDLWTKEMMVEEMQHLFYETFKSMAETYHRATNDSKTADEIGNFAATFGRITKVIQ